MVPALKTYFKSVGSGSSARRPERRNRSVLDVHEDFEHRATRQSGRAAAFETRSKKWPVVRNQYGLNVDLDKTTYYLGWETLIPSSEIRGMAVRREALFAFMSSNATRASTFFTIPPKHVVEIGIDVEL
jgi:K+ transporter